MKNHLYKAALVAALGLAVSTVAKASDLYVGFNDSLGNTGNDYVIDLGAFSQFTLNSTVTGSISSSLFNTAFGSDAKALNDVAVGAVAGGSYAANAGSLPNYAGTFVYSTGNSAPSSSKSPWSVSEGLATSINTGEYTAAGSPTDLTWDYLIAVSPTLGATGPSDFTGIGNPESYLANGDVSLTLWYSAKKTGLTTNPNAFAELGTITIDANSTGAGADTITFTGADVVSSAAAPEPTTYGLFAGVGLLGLALRRQFASKVA